VRLSALIVRECLFGWVAGNGFTVVWSPAERGMVTVIVRKKALG
jgi:hypothetical protein